MRPIQSVIIVVNRKSGWFPARGGCMAHRTIRRDIQCNVVRVGASVVIGGMATLTSVRRVVVVPSGMTKSAVVGDSNVGAREWVNLIVVISGRGPSRFGVAQCAIRRELRSGVVRVARAIVIRLVTAHASVRCVVVIPVVAIRTTGSGMRPIQSVIIVVNRKSGWFPARGGCMAHRTIRRDIQCNVVRVGASVVIGGMATLTSVRRVVVVPSGMTKCAIVGNRNMRSCKWIYRVVVKS